MKSFAFTTLLLMSYLMVEGQDILLLNNGDKMEYKNFKFDGDEIRLSNTPQGKITLSVNNIKGFCSPKGEHISTLKSEIKKDKVIYYFAENVVDGVIKLYKRTEVNTMMFPQAGVPVPYGTSGATMSSGQFASYSLYIQKDNMYEELFALKTITQNKKEKTEILKKYIGDNIVLKAQLDNPEFKLNEESILRVVKAYNLAYYQPVESTGSNKSTVLFYVKDKTNSMDSLSVTVNDGVAEPLPKGRAIAVQLSTEQLNKVCVKGYCDLLLGGECFIKYIEILVDDKPLQITFTQVSSNDANRYFTYYRNNLK